MHLTELTRTALWVTACGMLACADATRDGVVDQARDDAAEVLEIQEAVRNIQRQLEVLGARIEALESKGGASGATTEQGDVVRQDLLDSEEFGNDNVPKASNDEEPRTHHALTADERHASIEESRRRLDAMVPGAGEAFYALHALAQKHDTYAAALVALGDYEHLILERSRMEKLKRVVAQEFKQWEALRESAKRQLRYESDTTESLWLQLAIAAAYVSQGLVDEAKAVCESALSTYPETGSERYVGLRQQMQELVDAQ